MNRQFRTAAQRALMLVGVLSIATVASGCGPTQSNGGSCSASNCADGCCDTDGKCQPGNNGNACGSTGNACVACTGGKICVLGQCTGGSGGSGGSAGGGVGGSGGSGGSGGRGGSGGFGGGASGGGSGGSGGGGASCSAANCAGCCFGTACMGFGVQNNSYCGRYGNTCGSCPGGYTCSSGVCAFSPGGGSGGSGGGGGGSGGGLGGGSGGGLGGGSGGSGGGGTVVFPDGGALYVFVTSGTVPGDLKTAGGGSTGPVGGDNLCQTFADARYLGGTWRAYLASTGVLAHDRFSFGGPWILLGGNGGIVFANSAALAVTSPLQAINRDETGALLTLSSRVWTGASTGGGSSGDTCADWTSTGSYGTYGYSGATDSTWRNASYQSGSSSARLYCFQQSASDGGTVGTSPKRVFVTSGTQTGDLKTAGGASSGILGGDALCQTYAAARSLGGTWKAYLAASGITAQSRFSWNGPWTLIGGDGGTVFANKAALSITGPLQAINRDETGALLTLSSRVWTGATTGGGSSGDTCADWTSTGSYGTYGYSGATDSSWRNASYQSGSSSARLYCFEQ